jgi:hypothetical protein
MKKKIFALAVAAMAVLGAQAQNMIDGHEYVDLGLPSGTLWATMNVGAASATERGTEYEGKPNDFGWGDGWILPTEGQWKELFDNCTVSHNGNKTMAEFSNIVFTFTSKINSKTVQMGGYIWDDEYTGKRQYILNSSKIAEGKTLVYAIAEETDGGYDLYDNYKGFVRPVVSKNTISSVPEGWTLKAGLSDEEMKDVTVVSGTTKDINYGSAVVVTPANIPVGKKIKSVKVIPTE